MRRLLHGLTKSQQQSIRKRESTMKIQTVTVEIHEKRNNPNAYGHYDSRVAYTAEVQDGEEAKDVVEQLQFIARQQVAIECNRWEAEVKREEQRNSARSSLRWIVDRAKNSLQGESDVKEFEKNVSLLPLDEQAEYRTRLEESIEEFRGDTRKYLDKLIVEAEKSGDLSHRQQSIFDSNLALLPEDEHSGWLLRLEKALAPKEEFPQAEIAPQVEPSITLDDVEEMPF